MPPKKGPKKANGYKMPDHLPAGTTLTDMRKKSWVLGQSVGVGGFGEIYLAAEAGKKADNNCGNVVKIEPKENGPLFVEMHFYMNVGKPELVEEWRKKNQVGICLFRFAF